MRSPCGEKEVSKTDKFRRLLPRDPFRLYSVEEWLRGFREQPLPNIPNVVYCRKCGIRIYAVSDHVDITACHVCGLPVKRLDETFWQRLSNHMMRLYRKDRLLFARLNGEASLVPPIPDLQGSLAWVTTEWRRAAKPPGRPRELERHLFLAFWLHSLARPRVVIEQEQRPQKEILRGSGKSRQLPSKELLSKVRKTPHLKKLPPIMTLSGAIELLTGSDVSDAIDMRVRWRQNQLFGGLSTKELVQIRSAFREDWKKEFGGVPIRLSRREAERMLVLYKNFQSGAKVRVKGIKLRDRPSRKKKWAWGDRSEASRT